MSKPNQQMYNPYPGLRPYHSDEHHLFFGRKKHMDAILDKLDKFRFVSVVGNSGSGKSSLVRAGVLPALLNRDPGLTCAVVRPGQHPIQELMEGILQTSLNSGQKETNREEIFAMLQRSDRGLIQWMRNSLGENQKLLILVDQFEELFRFGATADDENYRKYAEHFVQLLLRSVEQKEIPIYVLMTIRSDFLGDCEQFEGLPEAINDGQFLIPRMKRNEMMECITGPMEVAGGKIAPRLVNHLLDSISNNPDQLPVLQHVLMRSCEVWEKEADPDQPMDLVHYERTGGIDKALSNHAEEAYSELEAERLNDIAERMFKALTLKGADNRGVRRPTSVSKLAEICQASTDQIIRIANVFRRADRGLLMPPESKALREDSIIDISHESLMRIWERLKDWVDEEAESAELYLRLSESAELYLQNKSGLWGDPDLQIALDWKENQQPNLHWASQYNEQFNRAMQFLDASEKHKQFAEADKKRRNRVLLFSLVAVLVILSALTFWALREQAGSRKNAQLAMAEQKRAESQKMLAEQNYSQAELERKNAEEQRKIAESQKNEAEKQRISALQNEKEAQLQKLLAEKASLAANDARKRAELEKQIALLQKQISDSLRTVAEASEKQIYRSRILSLAQNLAIKSYNATSGTYPEPVKALLALQSAKFNLKYGQKDKDARVAMMSALSGYLPKDAKSHSAHFGSVTGISVSSQDVVASCSEDGRVVVCYPDQPGRIRRMPVTQNIFKDIVWNPAGDQIACAADNRSIYLFNAEDTTIKPTVIPTAHTDLIIGLGWVGNRLISVGVDKKLIFYRTDQNKTEREVALSDRPTAMSMSRDGKIICLGFENGDIRLFDSEKGELVRQYAGKGRIQSVCLIGTNRLAAGNNSGQLFIWKGEQLITKQAHKSGISSLSSAGGENYLASASFDGLLKVWSLSNLEEEPVVLTESEGSWLHAAAFSSGEKYLISGGKDKQLRYYLWDFDKLVSQLTSKVNRNFTKEEWMTYVGNDIPYVETLR